MVFAARGEIVFGLGLVSGGAGVALLSVAEAARARRMEGSRRVGPWKLGGGILTVAGVLLLLFDFFVAP